MSPLPRWHGRSDLGGHGMAPPRPTKSLDTAKVPASPISMNLARNSALWLILQWLAAALLACGCSGGAETGDSAPTVGKSSIGVQARGPGVPSESPERLVERARPTPPDPMA